MGVPLQNGSVLVPERLTETEQAELWPCERPGSRSPHPLPAVCWMELETGDLFCAIACAAVADDNRAETSALGLIS